MLQKPKNPNDSKFKNIRSNTYKDPNFTNNNSANRSGLSNNNNDDNSKNEFDDSVKNVDPSLNP